MLEKIKRSRPLCTFLERLSSARWENEFLPLQRELRKKASKIRMVSQMSSLKNLLNSKAIGCKSRCRAKSFDLLGFTHYWGLARNGIWTVKVKTAKDRFARGLRRINELLSRVRHMDIGKQHEMLRLKLLGHNQYYGITHNYRALKRFRATVAALWFKWLGRRFQKGGMRWDIFNLLLKRYRLPPAKVVHSIFRRAASP